MLSPWLSKLLTDKKQKYREKQLCTNGKNTFQTDNARMSQKILTGLCHIFNDLGTKACNKNCGRKR